MPTRATWILTLGVGLGAAQACTWPLPTTIAKPTDNAVETDIAPVSGMRRLSAHEYDNVVFDLLGDHTRAGSLLLPADARTPFDNDMGEQAASPALIEAVELLAREAAARLVVDAERRDHIVGCTPASSPTCFADFVHRFGRRALRKSLAADEAAPFLALADDHGFDDALEIAVSAFLQHPRFLYRVEIGQPGDDGTFRLTGPEIAARLSFLLWGSTPDHALLDAAESGGLDTDEGVRAEAERLLAAPAAKTQLDRLVAMWLGTETLPHDPALATAMRQETAHLLERVVFDESLPWRALFTFDETWVTPELADHYGFDAISAPAWVTDPSGDRAGILGHGTFLSVGAKFGDTSPTLRGLAVRERLLCQTIGAPPPGVSVDDPIPANPDALCKEDRYREAHATGGCASCHAQIDAIGFGLERYDALGRYRTHEPDETSCAISGDGTVSGEGDFNGPAELGALIGTSERIGPCLAQRLVQYTLGRGELDTTDHQWVDDVARAADTEDAPLTEVLLALVTHPAFSMRREEAVR